MEEWFSEKRRTFIIYFQFVENTYFDKYFIH